MKGVKHNSKTSDLVRLFYLCAILYALCFSVSCGNSENDPSLSSGRDSLRGTDSAGGMKVYLLPSPLQVSSVMKLMEVKYSPRILEKTENAQSDYQVSSRKALSLGVYSIDMGYASVYNDFSSAIKYASKIQGAMTDLGISGGVNPSAAERMEKFRNNNDSLYKIILESYSAAHEYFKNNEREDIGLMILTGAFIEGLYISSSLAKEGHNEELLKLIGLQKIFLENISTLLNKYSEQKDIQTVIGKINALSAAYADVDVHYDSKKDKLVSAAISSDQLHQICKNTGAIRNEIIN